MGPSTTVKLLLWIYTLLTSFVTSEFVLQNRIPPGPTSQPVLRHKRQYSTNDMVKMRHRINDVDDKATKAEGDVKEVLGYLKALGVHVSPDGGHSPLSREDSCGNEYLDGSQGSNEMKWTPFGTSKCVKLISEFHNYTNAYEVCRQQYRTEKDIAHPVVVALDSTQKATNLLKILRQRKGVTSVWINQVPASLTAPLESTCTELHVPSTNQTEKIEFKIVACARVNSVVCEKPVRVSFGKMVERQVETEELTKKFQNELNEAKDQIQHLRDEIVEEKRLMTESERNADIKCVTIEAQLFTVKQNEEKFVEVNKKLEAEMKLLQRNLEDLRAATEVKEILRTTETAELHRLLRSLELSALSQLSNLTTSLSSRQKAAETKEVELKQRLAAVETQEVELKQRLAAVETQEVELKQRLAAVERKGDSVLSNMTDVKSVVLSLEVWRVQTEEQMRIQEGKLTGLVKQVNQIRSTYEASLGKLTVAFTKVGEWNSGEHKPFLLQKALGVWYHIERFQSKVKGNPSYKCLEVTLSPKGPDTIDYSERYKTGNSNETTIATLTYTVDTRAPHYWTYSGTYNQLWLKTDYDNWRLFAWCRSQEISSCEYLDIHSRTRILPATTLLMLRDTAEKLGFPKENGVLIDQTLC